MKPFPRLYKRTSTGALQFWVIEVAEHPDHSTAYDIQTVYGLVGTDSPQATTDTIFKGKNIGKANETSPKQQAEAEAQARWEKQLKKGYTQSKEEALAGKLDKLITGGIEPMLAHTFTKQGHKIKYPCYCQPKLDGSRIIAILKDGKCTLWSRTRKPIHSLPHIVNEIEESFKDQDLILDGEAYSHAYKKDFEKIMHFVRQETPAEGHEIVEYHIYDIVTKDPFWKRFEQLHHLFLNKSFKYLKMVYTYTMIDSEECIPRIFEDTVAEGYEGIMLRNSDGLYVNKRSYDLQKVKEFLDDEFKIIGVEEGRGKLQGHVGAFICRTVDGQDFNVKMSGDTTKLKEYWENDKLWKHKTLTVQYQGLTAYGIPRFPVGLRFREEE